MYSCFSYLHLFNNFRVAVVQVRLANSKLMQIILTDFFPVLPGTTTEMTQLETMKIIFLLHLSLFKTVEKLKKFLFAYKRKLEIIIRYYKTESLNVFLSINFENN